MSGGFKDIIKREHIQALERREKMIEDNLNMRLFIIGKELKGIHDAQDLFYETFMGRTWPGSFKRFVAWLSKPKKQKNKGRNEKQETPAPKIIVQAEKAGGTTQ